MFEYASSFGKLIVGINTDSYLIQKSGRVLIPLVDRVYTIQSIKYVSQVVVFSEPNACDLLYKLQPSFFVKGPDYRGKNIPEEVVCNELNIKYLIRPGIYKYSTTELTKDL